MVRGATRKNKKRQSRRRSKRARRRRGGGGTMEYKIYTWWTGKNEMSQQRKDSIENLKSVSECDVVLITTDTLSTYIKEGHPLHEAYEYLSETQKGDYLKAYFMNFYGGGYSDIKKTTGSWKSSFDELSNSNKWICGYQELDGGVAYEPLKDKWRELIGNGAYICKQNTPLTNEWYNEMIKLLDEKLDALKKNPAKFPQDSAEKGTGYPIEWNEMNGRIFHKLVYKYKEHVLKSLAIPIFQNYRGGGNSTNIKVPFCIYSHSDYFDILKIQLDYLKTIFNDDSKYEVYLFLNKAYDDTKYKVIIYDESLAYMSRILHCIKQIEGPYFIISHENDILIRFDEKGMNRLIEVAKEHNIDYIDLKHDALSSAEIEVSDTLSISKKREDDPYTFSHQPSIRNKESAIKLYSKFAGKKYGLEAEGEEVQEYMKTQKVYTLVSKRPMQSLFFMVSPEYCFMHITQAGTLFPLRDDNGLDPSIQEQHTSIYAKYLSASNRKQSATAHNIQIERIIK